MDVLCRQVMLQLFDAVEFLHSKNIVHRDIKVQFIERLFSADAIYK